LLGLVAHGTELGLNLFLDGQVHLALGVVELALLFDQVWACWASASLVSRCFSTSFSSAICLTL
jgi:hypothetical protein